MIEPPAKPEIYLIAGEASGDQLGAELMRALKQKTGGKIGFSGVGGALMQAEGMKSLFPSSDIAMMMFAAVIKNFPLLLRRLNQAVADVLARQPDILVIIDSPEFTQRVAKRVRKQAPHIPIIKYVAPQVWAWRPKRAAKMRQYIDMVLALLPFEPEWFKRLGGPPTVYAGHPLIARDDLYELRPEDRLAREEKVPVLVVLPGSRIGEIMRLMAPFGETLALLAKTRKFNAALPVTPHLRPRIEQEIKGWAVKPMLIEGQEAKWAVFRKARAALAASGTVTLELALAQVPQVVAYKVEPWAAWIMRRLVTVDTIVLPNLIVNKKAVPEFYQDDARAKILAPELAKLLDNSAARQEQLNAYASLKDIMQLPRGSKPADVAAMRVLSFLNGYFREASGT